MNGLMLGLVLVVAHRGASTLAPENTLAAGRAAAHVGAAAWEFDVALSRDGVAVLMHDESPARTTDVARVFPDRAKARLDSFRLDELRRLDASARFIRPPEVDALGIDPSAAEPVPTLDEALALCVELGLRPFVELKTDDAALAAAVAAGLRRHELVGQAVAISFKTKALRLVKKQLPELRVMPLYSRELPQDPVAEALELGACGIDVHFDAASPELSRALKAAGLALNVWTVDNPSTMRRMAALGADQITTNVPHIALSLLDEQRESR